MSSPKPYDWRAPLLEALRHVPVMTHACEKAGIDYSWVNRVMRREPDFAAQVHEAMEQGVDRAEKEAFRRAIDGFEEPVIEKGRLAYRYERYEAEDADGNPREQWRMSLDDQGQPIPLTVRKHSDGLLSLVLKGRRKKIYADRTELTGADGGPVAQQQVVIATGVPHADDFSDLA